MCTAGILTDLFFFVNETWHFQGGSHRAVDAESEVF
jgi:hypothetical protein